MTTDHEPQPHMDPEGMEFFKKQLTVSRCYLEYGSGQSTLYAANVAQVSYVISVESDVAWWTRIKNALFTATSVNAFIEYCDIGETGDWGSPINSNRILDYWRYMAIPWNVAKAQSVSPDTVLIDGRFRVASFLFSLISARVGTLILFDDYLDRSYYHVVEEFCQLESMHGRMASFIVAKTFLASAISEKIAQYSVISS